MKHVSELILEITRQQLIFQDQLNHQLDIITSIYVSPVGIDKPDKISNIESELHDLTEFNCRINDSIQSVSADLYQK